VVFEWLDEVKTGRCGCTELMIKRTEFPHREELQG
jgi:hypothetical protein